MYTRTLGILRDLGLEEELAKFEAQDKHSLGELRRGYMGRRGARADRML